MIGRLGSWIRSYQSMKNEKLVARIKCELRESFLECACYSGFANAPIRALPTELSKMFGENEPLDNLYIISNGVKVGYLQRMTLKRTEGVLTMMHWGLVPEICGLGVGPALLEGFGLALNKGYGVRWIDFIDEPDKPRYINLYQSLGAVKYSSMDGIGQLFWRWEILS